MFSSSYLILFIILAISILECIGQSCLISFQKKPNQWIFFLAGLVFYSMICLLLVLSYQFKGMGIVNVLWSGISVLLIVSVGILFFHEKITKMDWIGIFFVLAGISLILWEGGHGVELFQG